MEVYHKGLSKLIPDAGLNGKIFRMSVNAKTIEAPNGEFMLPDRKHLVQKDLTVEIPPTMKANLNLLFNFMCNDVIKPTDSTCCRTGFDIDQV